MIKIPENIILPDYRNCGLNIAAAVLAHFGVPCTHPPQADVARMLAKKTYKNIAVMLFDGLGSMSVRELLPEDAFLRRCENCELTAVFPPTTVAATTSIESGEAPAEHGWLGWSQYIAPLDRLVDVFLDRDSVTHEKLGENKSVARHYMPYRNICEKLNDAGGVQAHIVSPFGTCKADTLDALFDTAQQLCHAAGRQYIYTYWAEPDHTMHGDGVMAPGEIVHDIDRRVEAFCRAVPDDTLVLLTADHGLMDCKTLCMEDYPALMEMCVRPFGLEARDAAFYIKPEYMDVFPQEFQKAFADKGFWLIKSEEAVQLQLFGPGKEQALFRQSLGDYLALSAGEYALSWTYDPHPLVGMHAGLSAREMLVPLIVCKR